MSQSFKHSDVFPVIYRLITDRTFNASAFVGHAELVDALLNSSEGKALVSAAEAMNKLDRRGNASVMVAWFSQRFTKGSNDFGELLERKKIGATWAYRSKGTTPTDTSAQELFPPDVDALALEGNPKLVTHLIRERKPKLRKDKLAAVKQETGSLACECCNFEAAIKFPGLESPIVEVHHRTMLSSQPGAVEIKLGDLAVLCPTCHRAIHRTDGLTVEAFKSRFFPEA